MKHEAKLQAEFFKIANNDPFFRYCIWATPNGLFNSNKAILNESKATGTLAGVWDLIVQKNNKLFFIETKIDSNNLTDTQKHFQSVRIREGVPAEHFFIYKNITEGIAILEKIKQLCQI